MGTKLEIKPKIFEVLDANDSRCTFRINIDVLNEAFGVGRSMYARAVYPDKRGAYIEGDDICDKFYIWMAKLYRNKSEWRNSISPDGLYIFEDAESTRKEDWISDDEGISNGMRIVFLKSSPNDPYKFAGVFKNDEMKHLHHSYVRIASKIRLVGNPVYKVELLDDNR